MDNQGRRTALARFACDFCRGKKIKCSRELPKCAACKPWPGPCNYSRQFPHQNVPRPEPSRDIRPVGARDADHSSLSARLDRIEANLETLTNAVHSLLAASTSRDGQSPALGASGAEIQASLPPPALESGSSRRDYSVWHLSSLDEATAHLSSGTLSGAASQAEYGLAVENLRDLTDALTSFRLDNSLDFPMEPGSRSYLIPDREMGNMMITRFLSLAEPYNTFFEIPSRDIIDKVVFKPLEAPPGWVVFVSYCLLASPDPKSDSSLASMLRWNVKLALQHASLFLVASRVNLQALMLLSFHGEDFASSPNMSWMLASHVCLQAQTLALHKPGPELDEESRQRQLSLFWAIFNSEKSCALAFGRPALLPASYYRDVELPSLNYLTHFAHYLENANRDGTSGSRSTFDAHIFLHNTELARLTGEILDCLAMDRPPGELGALMARLDAWYDETREKFHRLVTGDRELPESQKSAKQRVFGFTISFGYLHSRIILAKSCPNHAAMRVNCARQAIEILNSTVATWDSLYNGIIWHLLYHPFTPFFVLFGHIIHNPESPGVQADLQLLFAVADYFGNLKSRLTLLEKVASRLQRTAEVFAALAQKHVKEKSGAADSGVTNPLTTDPSSEANEAADPVLDLSRSELAGGFAHRENLYDGSLDDVDVDRFLSWIPEPLPEGLSSAPTDELVQENQYSLGAAAQPSRGQKRPFGATFDWFSWENYYSDL